MSASNRRATRAPSFCSASARLTAVVVRPPSLAGQHRILRIPCCRRQLLRAGHAGPSISPSGHCGSPVALRSGHRTPLWDLFKQGLAAKGQRTSVARVCSFRRSTERTK